MEQKMNSNMQPAKRGIKKSWIILGIVVCLYFSQCARVVVSQPFSHPIEVFGHLFKIGRASCRERVCQYV